MDHYEKKLIHRGKKLVKNGKWKQGNCLSFAHPNHSGHVPHASRVAESQFLKHTQQFFLVDINPDGGKMARKNIGRFGIGLKTPSVNTQLNNVNQNQTHLVQIKPEPRLFQITLDTKTKSIGVCDLASLDYALKLGQFTHLIYFDYAWRFPHFPIPTTHSTFNEHTCDFEYFQRTFSQLCQKIQDNNDSTLICCKRGVNRSICLVMYYLIKHQGHSFDSASTLIENEKTKISKTWNNLTNNRLKNFLRLLHSLNKT